MFARPDLEGRLDIGLASYAAVGITSALGVNAAYWVLSLLHFTHALQEVSPLNVRWVDPARSPGIVALARGFNYAAPYGAALLALAEFPLIYAYTLAPNSLALLIGNLVAPLIAFAAPISWITLSHIWLSRIIVREKRRILAIVEQYIQRPTTSRSLLDLILRFRSPVNKAESGTGDEGYSSLDTHLQRLVIADQITIYRAIAASSESTFSSAALVQYSAALVAISLPYIVRAIPSVLRGLGLLG
jgi:hypothetical protein